MQAQPECISCLFSQALNTARVVSADTGVHQRVLARVTAYAASASLDQTPARLSKPVYRIVAEVSGDPDPYARKKKETNGIALALLPSLREALASAADPLDAVLHAAESIRIFFTEERQDREDGKFYIILASFANLCKNSPPHSNLALAKNIFG